MDKQEKTMLDLIKSKLGNRKGHDGIVLIAAGITFLLLKPIANIVAVAAIGYGAWTICMDE